MGDFTAETQYVLVFYSLHHTSMWRFSEFSHVSFFGMHLQSFQLSEIDFERRVYWVEYFTRVKFFEYYSIVP